MPPRQSFAIALGFWVLLLCIAGCQQPGNQAPVTPTTPPATTMSIQATAPPLTTSPAVETPGSTTGRWQAMGHGIPAQIAVADVAFAPSDPQTVYLAAYEPDGLYRSLDGGASWQPTSRGFVPFAALTLAIDPVDPETVWIGTVAGGYRTTDGGQSWQRMAGLPESPIYDLELDRMGDRLYAAGYQVGVWLSEDRGQTWAASQPFAAGSSILSLLTHENGWVFAGTGGQGLWLSRNGGQSWHRIAALSSTHVTSLAAAEGEYLYALTEGQLHASADLGRSWTELGPNGFEGLSLSTGVGPRRLLYLGSKGQGVAVSKDGGQNWQVLGAELYHADITCIALDPSAAGRAMLGTRYHGLYATKDGGKYWSLSSETVGQPVINALVQDVHDPQRLFAGTLDGVYRSDDGGRNWRPVSGAMGKLFVEALAMAPTSGLLYAGTQSGVYVSRDRGASWTWATADLGDIAVFAVAVDPHDETRIYAGSWGHNILRSNDGGQSWAPIHRGLETLSVHALAVDPIDPARLYAGTVETIWRSIDSGQSWQATPLADRPLTTFALAALPSNPVVLYAGTTAGVYRSTTGELAWVPAGLETLDATVTAVAIDPHEPDILYAGTEHHGVFRSDDGGEHWRSWGLAGTSVYAILLDANGQITLGTDRGLFRSQY